MSDTPKKDRIGDYELIALIGDGAQGRVYKARYAPLVVPPSGEPSPDSPTVASSSVLGPPSSDTSAPADIVALKVVRITGEDEKLRLKFQEQADILRRLSHTNIVAYRDCFSWHAGEWDESQCLVMELLEGETLHERLKNAKTGLPWTQVEEIFEQCLAGLIHARERGITHRDLKPSNIFLTKDGQAKLIDFDIARRDDSGQMSTAGWKGTFDYMAPDFITINGFRGDEVSDVFSLGVCFYQALTGSLPFEPLGETAHIGYLNRWRDNGSPTPSFRPGVFRVLSNAKALVTRCLAARRDQRYPSFAAMLQDFRTIRYRRIRHKGKEEYELLAVLGRGGFGEVFKARRVSDGLLVAVKYLFSEKQSERFVKEAKILQQYPHPNLVKYVDFMVIEGTAGEKQFFLVMEFLEGMPGWTLRPRLKNEGKLEAAEAVPLFCAYLSALQFLHENARPIIHRDIKPGNLYAPVGQPEKGKIFDLGIARDVSGTVTVGGVPGTLDYMAPEFAEAGGDRGSPQSDLYALGLCLYEAIAGKPVYDRLPSDLNSAWLAFQDRLRKPLAVTFDAPAFSQYPRLKQLILKALADKPESRFRSAAEMRKELAAALLPASLETTHDADGFDANDVTMATFAGGNHSADHQATLGTRPLAPADLPDAIAALRNAAPRPPASDLRSPASRPDVTSTLFPVTFFTHKRLLIGGGIAAFLLLGLGELYLFSGKGHGSAPEGERPREQPAVSLKPVPATPLPSDVRPPSAPATQPPAQPATSNVQPVTVPAPPPLPPVTAAQRAAAEVAATLAGLPDRIAAAPAGAELQNLAAAFLKLEATPSVKLTPEQVASAEKAFAARYLALAQPLAAQAADAYAAGKAVDAEASQKRLADLAEPVPVRFGKAALDALQKEVAAARQAAEVAAARAKEKAAEDAARAKEQAASAARLDTLAASLAPSATPQSPSALLPAFQALAAFPAATLADPGVSAKWTAARAACAAQLEQALAQKDPLEQRAQRLKAAEETLAAPVVAQVLADLAPALLKSLEAQKAFGILRLVNQGDAVVQISAREFAGKVPLAGGEVKEWILPVSGESLTVSVSVDGGSRFRSRIETLKLPRSGGLERAISTLESPKPEATAAVPTAPALVKPPATEQPVTNTPKPVTALQPATPPPAQPVTGNPQPVTTASLRAALFISISPKTAALLLDDKPVEAGQLEITPNENHKVVASCPGYKPVQQYYKARPGETRKIDILLEKEPKKTLFGF